MTRIGSLFTGTGALDHAVQSVLGGEVCWFSDNDPAASALLAHHYPHIPNLGDVTTVDWAATESVEVMTGGFPCTDISVAGQRLGLRPDTRSGLWKQMAYAISQIRPALVLIENVRGLCSAEAHSDMEPCPLCVGDRADEPVLRALGAVLGDLADLRYDAVWCGLPASAVGACHARFRIFIAAHRQDHRFDGGGVHGNGGLDLRTAVAHADRESGQQRRTAEPAEAESGRTLSLPGGRGTPAADAGCDTRPQEHPDIPATARRSGPVLGRAAAWPADLSKYRTAIVRHELAFGRPVPPPREPGRNGERLSPRFGEWMMDLPEGWVTAVPGLSRSDMFRLLGNGIVVHQGVAALDYLIAPEYRGAA